jgi:hypothetical protein
MEQMHTHMHTHMQHATWMTAHTVGTGRQGTTCEAGVLQGIALTSMRSSAGCTSGWGGNEASCVVAQGQHSLVEGGNPPDDGQRHCACATRCVRRAELTGKSGGGPAGVLSMTVPSSSLATGPAAPPRPRPRQPPRPPRPPLPDMGGVMCAAALYVQARTLLQ